MELFIEKDFLDNFHLSYKKERIQKIVAKLFTEYGNVKAFINCNEEEYQNLMLENEYFALMNSNGITISIINNISEKEIIDKSSFEQTLVFSVNENKWFDSVRKKGALCFSFENYERDISRIIDKLHFKIDLSVPFRSWNFMKDFEILNFNKVTIVDNYILSDKGNQKMVDNIIPIMQKMLSNNNIECNVTVYTKDLGEDKNKEENLAKKEKAKKRIKALKSVTPDKKINFVIVSSNSNIISEIVLHDRNIQTNFSMMDSGVGFNLLPWKDSNSQMISETIFDKYTYDRMRRINSKIVKSCEKYRSGKKQTSGFMRYPEL